MFGRRVSMLVKPGQHLPKNRERSWSLRQKTSGVRVLYSGSWIRPRHFVRL